MTDKQKWTLVAALALYPAVSGLDLMFWSLTGISFFFSPGGDDLAAVRARLDHSMTRTFLTIGMGFAAFAVAFLVETKSPPR